MNQRAKIVQGAAASFPEAERGAQSWNGLFDNVVEADCLVTEIEGKIPSGLVGTMYRNGPAKRDFSECFFDGDGMIRALTIAADGTVRYQAKYVQTSKYLVEKDAPKKKVRTAGTQIPGGIFKNMFKIPANEANTSATVFGGKLLATEEGGPPYSVDLDTLETIGTEHYDGALPKRVAFSAHPHIDPNTKELYNFGMVPGKQMGLQTYKVDANNKMTMLGKIILRDGQFCHDFALSGNYMIHFITPLVASMPKFLFGLDSFFGAMQYKPELGADIALTPRSGGAPIMIKTDAFLAGHIVGAWDEGDNVFVDICTTSDAGLFDDVANYKRADFKGFNDNKVHRYQINVKTRQVSCELMSDMPLEFPRINHDYECKPSDWAYFGGSTRVGEGGLYRATIKMNRQTADLDIYDFGPNCWAMEPVFIPRPDGKEEDDGWVMTWVYQAEKRRTDVAIFDAKGIADGPLALIKLPESTGTTFHGFWQPR